MQRFAEVSMWIGFILALIALAFRPSLGTLMALYGLGLMLTGGFAAWQIRKRR